MKTQAEKDQEASVKIPALSKEAVTVYTDTDCSLVIADAHIKGVVMLSMVDGGGFTGLLVAVKDWPEIKKKIESFLYEAIHD